ncbi:MAG: carboxyl transferase domain-containing protein [Planctomycetota bacterium]
MAFLLPFETEIIALDQRLAGLPEHDPDRAVVRARLVELEREVYSALSAHDTFLLSGHPLRPKALDYIRHIFQDVRLLSNPDVRGDHLVVAGEAQIEIDGRLIDVMVIGQQTGPSSQQEELLKLPVAEYRRWNQGMGFPDGYRKAVYFMDLAERRGWPVVVFVDTPGADPSEFSEEQGQAFAINEVIHKTTSLKTPNLSYIISLGASGGAIAITPTNRTIMNQYATYMVISPGGCASILFRNRSPDSIRRAAEGLCLTSADAVRQSTVDDVVEEGLHPGHRYPGELLEKAKDAIERNLAQLVHLSGPDAEEHRRAKFFKMGVWSEAGEKRAPNALAKQAASHRMSLTRLQEAIADYFAEQNHIEIECNRKTRDEAAALGGIGPRQNVARLIYAIEKADAAYLCRVLSIESLPFSGSLWAEIREFALARRYGHKDGRRTFHPNGGESPYRRLHPVDWIRRVADEGSFREFAETIRYCSVDQLGFPQYPEALERGITNTGLHSGLITGGARIGEHKTVLAINNFGLAGSSLSDEIGEKFRFAAQRALTRRRPLISVAMGGGARMQEGTPSMHRNIPKAQHALNLLEEACVPHISVICDPTLGGTAISYGLRGDYMIVVEGSANIGFSGKRVVEQFQERKVAADFQHESWLLHHGFVDESVATDALRGRLAELLDHVAKGGKLSALQTRRPRSWKPTQERLLGAASPQEQDVKKKERSQPRERVTV